MNYKRDYYKILNVDKNADKITIRKAYKKLALKYHPDVNKEKNAARIFKIINEAYSVLCNDEKRKEYNKIRNRYLAKLHKNKEITIKQNSFKKYNSRKRRNRINRLSKISQGIKIINNLEKDYGLISGLINLGTDGLISSKGNERLHNNSRRHRHKYCHNLY